MDESLESAPELVFGLVAPIGVDLDLITDILKQELLEMGYGSHLLKLTEIMTEIDGEPPIVASAFIKSYEEKIAYANAVRARLGDDALAALAIGGIRKFRAEEWLRRQPHSEMAQGQDNGKDPREIPLPNQAYIIRQLKRPEEVALLRRVYGRQFILLSNFAPQSARIRRIEVSEKRSCGGLTKDVVVRNSAFALVMKDDNEGTDVHGQKVRDAFHLGDVFIDATSQPAAEANIKRFVQLLFGDNSVTPNRDEYGMYMAKSASLRSADLSRQVGAAIFRTTGEVISLGCNEVPKARGGTYWAGDANDARDFVLGCDPNDQKKFEVFVDLVERMRVGSCLSPELCAKGDASEIAKELSRSAVFKESKLMDILEFGRVIHAEMSAICDAARSGLDTQGATLYCTTFPCHMCAKHIVAAGIDRVVYIEPYPKSYATDLHQDSIDIEGADTKKVQFEAFKGISPFRYRDLFEKQKRKDRSGIAQRWYRGVARPRIETYQPNYCEIELKVLSKLKSASSSS
ncbi:MAG: deoxycytidylate deaminase [Hyphomicrobium sp.]|jgi:cytidine deaminase|uniref:anti-phage dCTP deaminase n=1 Tax=Hyphomicrobium sp. TaxID=82 RepID=UPI0025BF88BE|nr:anti-phage dCTP deaminase [Hyphomicrobium sp.]MBX9863376.1 deoxycytidylate deaminase [Hyphomicrobium sp.]